MKEKNNSELYKKCYDKLIHAKKLILSTHENPDGDAIGSVLALLVYSKQRGIDAKAFLHSPVPYYLKFMDGIELIQQYNEEYQNEILSADTIFIVDLNESHRLGSVENPVLKSNAKKVVVDHHILPADNKQLTTDIFISDPDASSTGELIFNILKCNSELIITPQIAEALYTAIMTDTGSFRFSQTDSVVHRIVAELIDCGAEPAKIYDEYYNNIPPKVAKLQGEAFAGIELYYGGQLCIMTLTREHFCKTGCTVDDVEGIVEHSVTFKGVKAGVLITEKEDGDKLIIKLSFRSKGDVNIRDIALLFGGGGHEQASGAKLFDTSIEAVKENVIEKFNNLFT